MDFIIERWSSSRGPDWHRVGLRRHLSVDLSDPRRELRPGKTTGTRQAGFAAGVPTFWRLARSFSKSRTRVDHMVPSPACSTR